MRKNSNTDQPTHRHQLVEFNPAWLDERGWMTQLPYPYFASLGITDPSVTMVVGVRVVEQARYNVEQVVICKFKIGKSTISQELPKGGWAIIDHGQGEVTILDKEEKVDEKWELIARDKHEGITTEWFCAGKRAWIPHTPPPETYPASCKRLFSMLNGYLVWMNRKAGHLELEDNIYVQTLEQFKAVPGLEATMRLKAQQDGDPMDRLPTAEEVHFYNIVRNMYQASSASPWPDEIVRSRLDEATVLLRKAQQVPEWTSHVKTVRFEPGPYLNQVEHSTDAAVPAARSGTQQ